MEMIELRQIEYFVRVADELHFGRAAKSLRIAQPPLSQQIQKLERRLGVTLFERSSRHVELTQAGQLILPAARRAIEEANSFVRLAHASRDGHAGLIRLGFVSAALDLGLPALIRSFRESSPLVMLTANQMSVLDQAVGLAEHALDVGFTYSELTLGAPNSVELIRRDLVVVLPAGHPKALDRRPIELRSLEQETFIGYSSPANTDLSGFVTQACLAAGFAPRISYHGPQLSTGVAMCAAGLGVTLAPLGDNSLSMEGIVWRTITKPVPSVGISLVYDAARLTAPLERFVAFARETGLHA